MRILEDTDDPDVRKSVYALFASLAIVMKEEISPVLPKIVEQMINSIQSSEGIVVRFTNRVVPTTVRNGLELYCLCAEAFKISIVYAQCFSSRLLFKQTY